MCIILNTIMDEIKILDHGYLKLIEAWGTGVVGKDIPSSYDNETFLEDYECGIIEAARQSTQGSFRGWDRDEKLLKYMYDNKHSTPFEFAGMVIEVKAPIMVFREWHRHRTQSYNEMSARYAPLPDVNYIPTVDRCIVVPGTNKQASGVSDRVPTHAEVLDWLENYLLHSYTIAQKAYDKGLEIGIPKEVARLPVPVGRYTQMRASTNLRNWLAFLTLRMAPNAQYEIRMYANALAKIMRKTFPKTMELFDGQ